VACGWQRRLLACDRCRTAKRSKWRCGYGWIDAQTKSDDENAWLQKFTPRAKKSIWSKINRQKALALIEAGQMKPAGLEEIERAKKMDGGTRRMTRPAPRPCPMTFKPRWKEMRGRRPFSAL